MFQSTSPKKPEPSSAIENAPSAPHLVPLYIRFARLPMICCACVALVHPQTIHISGTVTDTGGTGIAGATVGLEEMGLATSTDSDGAFVLTDSSEGTRPYETARSARSTITISRGAVIVLGPRAEETGLCLFSTDGRRVHAQSTSVRRGRNTFTMPQLADAVYIYRITLGHETHLLRGMPFGTWRRSTVSWPERRSRNSLHRRARADAAIDDILFAAKQEYLEYRCAISTPDTSGVEIVLIASAGTVTDADGNTYQTVRIGTQQWTVENLRTTVLNDGTEIAVVTGLTEWEELAVPALGWYKNSVDPEEQKRWGAFYNWLAVKTGKLAPAGWRVATQFDWTVLQDYLIANGHNYDGTTSENKIAKSLAAKTDWTWSAEPGDIGNDPSTNNSSGFSALAAGWRNVDGRFGGRGVNGQWWTATEEDGINAWGCELFSERGELRTGYFDKTYGYSVRLVKAGADTGRTSHPSGEPSGDVVEGMVLIPAKDSTFLMGSTNGDTDERPVHEVSFTYDFWVDTTEVTNAQYAEILNYANAQGYLFADTTTVENMSGNRQQLLDLDGGDLFPSHCEIDYINGSFVAEDDRLDYPVIYVTWYGSAFYCNLRSEIDSKAKCYDLDDWSCDFSRAGYRLPTEAEWEYSCRAGTYTDYYWGDTFDPTYSSYDGNDPFSEAVGQKKPNGFGLYGMSGKTGEWCNDWYDGIYYSVSPGTDPVGPSQPTTFPPSRVIRGGSPTSVRSANRHSGSTDWSYYCLGFRVVLPAP